MTNFSLLIIVMNYDYNHEVDSIDFCVLKNLRVKSA
jgi:hypothetical protein